MELSALQDELPARRRIMPIRLRAHIFSKLLSLQRRLHSHVVTRRNSESRNTCRNWIPALAGMTVGQACNRNDLDSCRTTQPSAGYPGRSSPDERRRTVVRRSETGPPATKVYARRRIVPICRAAYPSSSRSAAPCKAENPHLPGSSCLCQAARRARRPGLGRPGYCSVSSGYRPQDAFPGPSL